MKNFSTTIDFGSMDNSGKKQLLLLLCQVGPPTPFFSLLRRQSVEKMFMLCEFLSAKLEVTLTNSERDLAHFGKLLEREETYHRLLLAQAPKKVLRHLYAKSVRTVEKDRQVWNIANEGRGRPAKITGDLAYEVMGLWDVLTEEGVDMANRLLLVLEEFPELSIGSIYDLVESQKKSGVSGQG